MRQATLVWDLWQRLLNPFASAFTRPSYRRFVEWITWAAPRFLVHSKWKSSSTSLIIYFISTHHVIN